MAGRTSSGDIAGLLSTGLSTGLIVFILGALGLLFYLSTQRIPGSAQPAGTLASPPASEPSDVAPAGDATGDPDAVDIDADGDTAADDESRAGGDAAPSPGPAAGGQASDARPGSPATAPRPPRPTEPSPDRADRAVATGPSARASPGAAPTAPAVAGAGSEGSAAPPDRDGGPGLFSADDPTRQVAIVPNPGPAYERVVHADLDGDGEDERIWSAVVRNQVVTRVERAIDGAWTPIARREGGIADRLVSLQVEDLTGDGRPEVHTRQWVGTEGESRTLWAFRGDDLVRMEVRGDCADGSNTIGLVGALTRVPDSDRRLLAVVCPDRTLPPQKWSSALYAWRGDHWGFVRRQGEAE